MYSILIVDDEAITRKGLINHVGWEKLDISEVNSASNAKEAIAFLQNNETDIILSDIRMTGMNGIEMCKEIKKIRPDCQIVFLSGYSDKEYLKGAIELEAVSYVEKPISIPEIEETLAKAIQKVESINESKEHLSKVLEENQELIKSNFIQHVINNKSDITQIKEFMDRLGLKWEKNDRYNIVLFKVSGDREEVVEKLAQAFAQSFEKMDYLYYVKDYKYIVFLCAYSSKSADKMRGIVENVSKLVGAAEGYKINVSFGSVVTSIMNVYKSYQSAVILMQQFFYKGYNKVNIFESKEEKKLKFDESIIEDFCDAVKGYSSERAKEIVDSIFEELKNQDMVMVNSIKGIYYKMINIVLVEAENAQKENEISENEMMGLVWEKLNSIETIYECHEYLSEEMDEYFKNSESLATNSRIIVDIMTYIKENYSNKELCLNDVADHVYLTPNYMTVLFKKKLGKTVGQYITDVRIEEAKTLLRDRKLKLADVAIKVGYKDANYFTKVFRKNVGVNPKDYRDK